MGNTGEYNETSLAFVGSGANAEFVYRHAQGLTRGGGGVGVVRRRYRNAAKALQGGDVLSLNEIDILEQDVEMDLSNTPQQ